MFNFVFFNQSKQLLSNGYFIVVYPTDSGKLIGIYQTTTYKHPIQANIHRFQNQHNHPILSLLIIKSNKTRLWTTSCSGIMRDCGYLPIQLFHKNLLKKVNIIFQLLYLLCDRIMPSI